MWWKISFIVAVAVAVVLGVAVHVSASVFPATKCMTQMTVCGGAGPAGGPGGCQNDFRNHTDPGSWCQSHGSCENCNGSLGATAGICIQTYEDSDPADSCIDDGGTLPCADGSKTGTCEWDGSLCSCGGEVDSGSCQFQTCTGTQQ